MLKAIIILTGILVTLATPSMAQESHIPLWKQAKLKELADEKAGSMTFYRVGDHQLTAEDARPYGWGGADITDDEYTLIDLGETTRTIPPGFLAHNLIWGVWVPPSVRTIGEGAFYGNPLSYVEFNEGLEEIGDNAFVPIEGERPLKVVIPASVKRIGDNAFGQDIVEVTFRSGTVTLSDVAFPANLKFLYERHGVGTYIRDGGGWVYAP